MPRTANGDPALNEIVVCCGMRRGGSTLQTNLVAAILDDAPLKLTDPANFERRLAEGLPDHAPLVLKTHRFGQVYTAPLAEGRIKACYVYRDLRDVVVSMANKYQKSHRELLAGATLTQLRSEYHGWTRAPKVYVARYEDMMVDLKAEIARLAAYLGRTLEPQRIAEIAGRYELQEVRRRQAGFDFDASGAGSGADRFDPATLLHRNHVHSGASGQWHEVLTRSEIAVIEAHSGGWLIDRGYSLSMHPLEARIRARAWRFAYRLGNLLRRLGLRRG